MVNNPPVELLAELGSGPREVSRARRALARALDHWGLDGDGVDVAILLTSELVTNAIRHGTSPILLSAGMEGSSLRVEVQDRIEIEPQVRQSQLEDEDGRGLQLVDVLADEWGWRPHAQGKQVWFVLRGLGG